jgi:threonine/homoserine/homoserine lactone efflux protein
MHNAFYFYFLSFFISFGLSIPVGPVNIEILKNALKKNYSHASSVAVGAALGNATWALVAFLGMSPFISSRYLEASLLLITGLITIYLSIGIFRKQDIIESPDEIIKSIKRKRWYFLKGYSLIIINPLGILSWMIILSFLRKMKIFIPAQLNYEIIFFFIVSIGAASYFLLVIFITNKMKQVFNPKRSDIIIHYLGYVLVLLGIYFIGYSLKLFFCQYNHLH